MKQPVWELFVTGTANPVAWQDHKPNPRFAIYSSGTTDKNDDLVLDKETGLIWPRNASIIEGAHTWLDANSLSRQLKLVHRIAWRLPTVEELSSLIDTRNVNPALPSGHPFLNVQFGDTTPAYWTSTNSENDPSGAWFVNLGVGEAGPGGKTIPGFAWPVRAGRGGVNWS